ncbi:MAG: hypothetical protein AT715_06885 [Thermoproteus sp. JCHS_4]|jgi:hypothetical protein|nr:MAG: hypothetical protein AT715_06885 [Thermoproteus sp. JCHS_4]
MAVELAPVPKPYETKMLFRDQPARCCLCGRELPYAESMARRVAQRLRESGLLSDHVYLCEDCRLKSFPT